MLAGVKLPFIFSFLPSISHCTSAAHHYCDTSPAERQYSKIMYSGLSIMELKVDVKPN